MSLSLFNTPTWQAKYLGNTLESYFISIGLFVLLIFAFWVFQKLLLRKLDLLSKKTKTDLDDQIIKVVKSIKPPFYVSLSLLLAADLLNLGETSEKVITILILILVNYQVIRTLSVMVDYVSEKLQKKRGSTGEQEAIETLAKIAKGILWLIGILVILQNIGIEVTSLVAGLGIGGIAIAFALQNILGDLFSSFAIIFDKPFEPGDFIVTKEHKGVVEDIGIKTTRIRALQGEEIVISNAELTNARIQNFKKMKERRVSFTFGVLYETKTEELDKIPSYVKEIIDSINKTRFDRAHFNEFGDSALNYEVVYYVETPDYNEYCDIHQKILINIKKKFDKKNIEFAYPTQTVYMAKE